LSLSRARREPQAPAARRRSLQLGDLDTVGQYVLRRLLMLIPVLFGVSIIVFSIMQLTPGDPALLALGEFAPPEQLEALREQLGLNDPPHVPCLRGVSKAAQLDLGQSRGSRRPVTEEFASRLPATGQLALYAVTFAALIGIPAGVISATRPNSLVDNAVTVAALAGVSMPVFWQALMLVIIFSVPYNLRPSSGMVDGWKSFVLPVVTLGTSTTAGIARMTRATMLEALQQDYVRTARAKGLSERVVVYRHTLR